MIGGLIHLEQLLTICSGSALSDNLLVDVGISQYQYNVGQQLLSVGIVVLEVREEKKRHADLGELQY